jgi:thioredoxin reductase
MRADVDEIRLAQPHRVTMIPERTVEGMSEDGVSLRLRHASQPAKEYDVLHADTVIVAIGQDPAEDAAASLLNRDHFIYAGDAIRGGQIVAGASYCQRKARRG